MFNKKESKVFNIDIEQQIAQYPFKDLLIKAGFWKKGTGDFDKKRAAKYLHCSEKTLERWMYKGNPCKRAMAMVEQLIKGNRPTHEDWSKFYFCKDGYLWTPHGARYTADSINRMEVLHSTVNFHRAKSRALEIKLMKAETIIKNKDRLKALANEMAELVDDFDYEGLNERIMAEYEVIQENEGDNVTKLPVENRSVN